MLSAFLWCLTLSIHNAFGVKIILYAAPSVRSRRPGVQYGPFLSLSTDRSRSVVVFIPTGRVRVWIVRVIGWVTVIFDHYRLWWLSRDYRITAIALNPTSLFTDLIWSLFLPADISLRIKVLLISRLFTGLKLNPVAIIDIILAVRKVDYSLSNRSAPVHAHIYPPIYEQLSPFAEHGLVRYLIGWGQKAFNHSWQSISHLRWLHLV